MKVDTSINGNGVPIAVPTDVSINSLELGIRRSARNKRPRGELIVVSSNDTLLDLKMKVNFYNSF